MRTLQVGDILKKEGSQDLEVMATTGKVIGHSIRSGEHDIINWNTPKDIKQQGWKLVEKKWKPECQEEYYYPCAYYKDFYSGNEWEDENFDKILLERGLVFKTSEEAIAKCKKMLSIK